MGLIVLLLRPKRHYWGEQSADVKAGEVLVIPHDSAEKGLKPSDLGSFHISSKVGTATAQCIFEYVYFSRETV